MGGANRGTRPSYANARYGLKPLNRQTSLISTYFEPTEPNIESEVNEYLKELLKQFNDRDSITLNQRLDSIIEILKTEFEGSVNLRFGGSVSKHTYVDGISDADLLALVNNSSLSDYSPNEVKSLIYEQLRRGLNKDCDIAIGKLSITIKYPDGMEVQLIPALKKYSGFRIPDKNGDEWSSVIRPDKFATRLTEVNKNLSGNVVRVIKIVKGINDLTSPETQLSGYHTESLAIEVFKQYPTDYPKTIKRMLKFFYEKASDLVKNPICDKTNQSLHVDDYLGSSNSFQRLMLSSQLKMTFEKMETADRKGSSDLWKNIIEG